MLGQLFRRPPRPSLAAGLRRQCSSVAAPRLRHFGAQRLRPWLAAALQDVGFTKPMAVQAAAMDMIAHHEDTVIHAATGSGKTLAFLVPLLSRLDPGKPLQLLILVPSRELALQAAHEVDRLLVPESSLHLALLVGGTGASDPLRSQRDLVRQVAARRAEVLIAEPQELARVLARPRPPPRPPPHQLDGREPPRWEERTGSRWGPRDEPAGSDAAAANTLWDALAANLDAVVLDEVDALLPKPLVNPSVGYYRQKDWAKSTREQRRSARPSGREDTIAARVLRRIVRTVCRAEMGRRWLGSDSSADVPPFSSSLVLTIPLLYLAFPLPGPSSSLTVP